VEGKQDLEDIAVADHMQVAEGGMLVEEDSLESSGAGHSSLYWFEMRRLD
jgi:hypothetical protein